MSNKYNNDKSSNEKSNKKNAKIVISSQPKSKTRSQQSQDKLSDSSKQQKSSLTASKNSKSGSQMQKSKKAQPLTSNAFRTQSMSLTLPPSIAQLEEKTLNNYMKNFMGISSFQSIQKGKSLIQLVKQSPSSSQSMWVINKSLKLFKSNLPEGVLCSFQFLRELVEVAHFKVSKILEQMLVMPVMEIIEYRSYIKGLQRGNSYFLNEFYRYSQDQKMNHLVKIGSTFFRMVHEALYIWGTFYFPNSHFSKMLSKLQKSSKIYFPKFPDQFKFYSQARLDLFRITQEKNQKLYKKQEQQQRRKNEDSRVIEQQKVSKNQKLSIKLDSKSAKQQNKGVNQLNEKTQIYEIGKYSAPSPQFKVKTTKDQKNQQKPSKQMNEIKTAANRQSNLRRQQNLGSNQYILDPPLQTFRTKTNDLKQDIQLQQINLTKEDVVYKETNRLVASEEVIKTIQVHKKIKPTKIKSKNNLSSLIENKHLTSHNAQSLTKPEEDITLPNSAKHLNDTAENVLDLIEEARQVKTTERDNRKTNPNDFLQLKNTGFKDKGSPKTDHNISILKKIPPLNLDNLKHPQTIKQANLINQNEDTSQTTQILEKINSNLTFRALSRQNNEKIQESKNKDQQIDLKMNIPLAISGFQKLEPQSNRSSSLRQELSSSQRQRFDYVMTDESSNRNRIWGNENCIRPQNQQTQKIQTQERLQYEQKIQIQNDCINRTDESYSGLITQETLKRLMHKQFQEFKMQILQGLLEQGVRKPNDNQDITDQRTNQKDKGINKSQNNTIKHKKSLLFKKTIIQHNQNPAESVLSKQDGNLPQSLKRHDHLLSFQGQNDPVSGKLGSQQKDPYIQAVDLIRRKHNQGRKVRASRIKDKQNTKYQHQHTQYQNNHQIQPTWRLQQKITDQESLISSKGNINNSKVAMQELGVNTESQQCQQIPTQIETTKYDQLHKQICSLKQKLVQITQNHLQFKKKDYQTKSKASKLFTPEMPHFQKQKTTFKRQNSSKKRQNSLMRLSSQYKSGIGEELFQTPLPPQHTHCQNYDSCDQSSLRGASRTTRKRSSSKLSERRSSLDTQIMQRVSVYPGECRQLLEDFYGSPDTLLFNAAITTVSKRRKSVLFC